MRSRGLAILGCTGSIGTQVLDVVRSLPDRFRVVGLAAGSNIALLRQQLDEFDVPFFSSSADAGITQRQRLGMVDLVRAPDVDLVVVATTSTSALEATIAALDAGRDVAVANKEVLVAAGALVTEAAARTGRRILPLDSEHSAIWQCVRGETCRESSLPDELVHSIVLTASGGALRDLPIERLPYVSTEETLRHPVWNMGTKVTIDSATLVNKAFEVIEAHWLFAVPFEKIDVVIHRESIIHSIVNFADGSSKAQLARPDMHLPIQYALTFPDRLPSATPLVDLISIGRLTFDRVDPARYPAFGIVVEAGQRGDTYPAAISAANDVVVERFAARQVGYDEIAKTLRQCVDHHRPRSADDLGAVRAAEDWARQFARQYLGAAR